MKRDLRCQLITLEEVYALSFSLAQNILASSFRPDLIIAIARGGFVPARLLCDFLDVKAMTSITVRHYTAAATQLPQAQIIYPLSADVKGKRVLIADDVNDSGDTLRVALEYITGFSPSAVRTTVLHEKLNSSFRTDFKAGSITEWAWIIYPWALVEDVGGLILKQYSTVIEVAELRQRLLADHGIEVSEDLIRKVLTIHADSKAVPGETQGE